MWQNMFLSEHLERLRFKIELPLFIHVTHDKRKEKGIFMYRPFRFIKNT